MAISKTSVITNFEAGTLLSVTENSGRLRSICVVHEVATTEIDNANDAIMLCPLPTNARVQRIGILNDDLDSDVSPALAVDVGLYDNDGATAKNADAYASAITALQGAVVNDSVNYAFEARNIDQAAKRVWEDAGDTTDPGGFYYLALDVTTAAATAAAGTLVVFVTYVVD